MKKKQIIIAVAALVVVAVLLFLFGRQRTHSRGAGERVGQLVVPGFKPDDARLIEITKQGADTVRLRKTGDAWTVQSSWRYPADLARVKALLDAIAELRVRDVRSQRPASYAQFDVDDAGGIWVHVHDAQDKQIAFICAGKTSSYDSGSNDVVEATPDLERNVGVGTERELDGLHFVDKTVLDFDPDDVTRVTLARPDVTAVLERIETEAPTVDPQTGAETTRAVSKWVIREPAAATEGEPATSSGDAGVPVEDAGVPAEDADETVEDADETACTTLVSQLSHLVAADIAGGKTVPECGLDRSQVTVRFEFSGKEAGGPVTLFIGDKLPGKDTDRYYAMTDKEGARIFVISGYYRDAAARDIDEFRKVKRNPPSEDQPPEADEQADQPADEPASEPE
jgi:hypothetical protein